MKKTKSGLLAAGLCTLAATHSAIAAPGTVDVQILAVNDFHGNLAPPTGSSGRVGATDARGAAYLATHVASLRNLNPNIAVVSARDMIDASPLLSALFHDEPTIEAFNLVGLDFNAVGNRFLAANVRWKKNGKPVFPAYRIKAFEGVQVAFIGMTLEGTPSIVSPAGISQLEFLDEADTVNALAPELKQRGVEAVVVVVHAGATQVPATSSINACTGLSGPIVDVVNRMSDEVDVVITGHTHQPYNCVIDGKLVTSAFSFGRLVTKIDLTVDRGTGEVVARWRTIAS